MCACEGPVRGAAQTRTAAFRCAFFSTTKQQSAAVLATRGSVFDWVKAGPPSRAQRAPHWSVIWYASTVATPSISVSCSRTGRAFTVTKRFPFSPSFSTAAACSFDASSSSLIVNAYSRAGWAITTPTRTRPSIAATASAFASPSASSTSRISLSVLSCFGS